MPTFNYEDEIEINKDDLENEWLNQTNLFSKYAVEAVNAEKKHQLIWERLKVRKAVLVKRCKKEHEKATGPEIDAYVRTDKKHKELKKELINAKQHVDLMNVAVQSFRMRKYALEQVTSLFFQEYHSEPHIAGAVKDRIKRAKRTKKHK